MPGIAASVAKKKLQAQEQKEKAIQQAVKYCQEDQSKPKKTQKGTRAICREVEEEWRGKGKPIVVSPATVGRCLGGGRSSTEFNTEVNAWLTAEEEEQVVHYCLELANRGFPLTHKTLKQHVDTIMQAKNAESFPEHGVGKNWTHRFLVRHSSRLQKYWSTPLDSMRGRAVNPTTHKAWYDLLGKTMQDNGIEENCIWACDETGIPPGEGLWQCVVGGTKKKTQYIQRNGNRETIMVIVTICADGSDIPPTVIYKGKNFSTNWHDENPLNVS